MMHGIPASVYQYAKTTVVRGPHHYFRGTPLHYHRFQFQFLAARDGPCSKLSR